MARASWGIALATAMIAGLVQSDPVRYLKLINSLFPFDSDFKMCVCVWWGGGWGWGLHAKSNKCQQ